ncbi:MAG: DUF99 family protein [Nanoarchaeota archaeon]
MKSRGLKKEVRVIGIDDISFDKFNDKTTKILGVIYRGGHFMDGVVSETIKVDGNDSTEKIISMIINSRFSKQIKYIMLDGIAVGGFNVIDVELLSRKTGLGVVVVMRDYPQIIKIKQNLENLGMKEKIPLLKSAGSIHKLDFEDGVIYFQNCGLKKENAEELLRVTCTHSLIPEPIRVAHLMGQGIVLGESKGSG